MFKNSRPVHIEWGDCDPAGIVFYPRFFTIFDASTAILFERALGMTKFEFLKAHNCAGIPLVDTRARFLIPAKYGDDVVVESTVKEFRRSSFDVEHRLIKGAELAVEGLETRVWTGRDPTDPDKIRSQPIPEEVLARFK
jgi:4-hydroxybenzoyl-CoA thioesterase